MFDKRNIKILLTGSKGLLGSYIAKELILAGIECITLDKRTLDITNEQKTISIVNLERPTHIINCAAFTDVVKAEEDRELCYSVNVTGVKNLVHATNNIGAQLIHFSTDYVFDGTSDDGLYYPDSSKNPLNYYGYSKHLGEEFIFSNSNDYLLIRTAWLFGDSENNFITKIIEKAKSDNKIYVVNDEFGSPTYAYDVAKALLELINFEKSGTVHLTNTGLVSRLDFAKQIILIKRLNVELFSLLSVSSKITRPKKIRLLNKSCNTILQLRDYYEALESYLTESNCD